MASHTWKLSSDTHTCSNDKNQNCIPQSFRLTSFEETQNQSHNERVNNAQILMAGGDSEGSSRLEGNAAIVCQNVKKWYNKGKPVLSDLNMRVPCGSVYALLGSSGCGKTTLLSCILGMSRVNEGSIFVYGENARINNIGIPGRNVGFMPQQISLYPEFTIQESFNYFASLGGSTNNQCVAKSEFFTLLLKLPSLNRKISTLSGGEQRRVSFAAALINEPPLLVLDEPTVGIDPIVRQTIWRYLEDLASIKRTSVIITTHYIEEARRANVIGVMRQGKMLVELTPQQLIENSNSTSLEGAVLQLFKSGLELQDRSGDKTRQNVCNSACAGVETQESESDPPKSNLKTGVYRMAKLKRTKAEGLKQSGTRIKALTYKNFIVMIRNIFLLSFAIWIPAAEVFTVVITYDFNPTNLKVGIINQEANSSVCDSKRSIQRNCSFEYLSCQYLEFVDHDTVEFVHFELAQDAEAAVHSGWLKGYLVFPPDISQNLFDLVSSGSSVDDSVYNSSIVIGRFDETDKAISIALKVTLFKALDEFISTLLLSCDLDPRIGKSSLQYALPLYGNSYLDFRDYTCPSVALASIMTFPIIILGTRLVDERNSGMLARCFVAGAQTWEIFISYFLTEFWSLFAQGILIFMVTLVIAGIKIVGSIWLAFTLLILSGFCGSSFGILLGTVCRTKLDVAILAMSIFFPNIFLSGIIWPVEGMPEVLQSIVNILPCTLPAESMRSIVLRGFGFFHGRVWPGFAVLVFYILFYCALTVSYKKFIKRK
ncbi:unnamed protein product [Orchesella dallaii]|uniref:ABC transporter G family member 23 n=1 Tax=Orchesella dallaii TaxID=48710 RepID=A0ABP1RUR5_9HEXA